MNIEDEDHEDKQQFGQSFKDYERASVTTKLGTLIEEMKNDSDTKKMKGGKEIQSSQTAFILSAKNINEELESLNRDTRKKLNYELVIPENDSIVEIVEILRSFYKDKFYLKNPLACILAYIVLLKDRNEIHKETLDNIFKFMDRVNLDKPKIRMSQQLQMIKEDQSDDDESNDDSDENVPSSEDTIFKKYGVKKPDVVRYCFLFLRLNKIKGGM